MLCPLLELQCCRLASVVYASSWWLVPAWENMTELWHHVPVSTPDYLGSCAILGDFTMPCVYLSCSSLIGEQWCGHWISHTWFCSAKAMVSLHSLPMVTSASGPDQSLVNLWLHQRSGTRCSWHLGQADCSHPQKSPVRTAGTCSVEGTERRYDTQWEEGGERGQNSAVLQLQWILASM